MDWCFKTCFSLVGFKNEATVREKQKIIPQKDIRLEN